MTLRENRIFVLLLVLIVLVGTILRFWSLDRQQMSSAELEYHYAARSVAQGSGPVLPSGESLNRGGLLIRSIASLQASLRDAESAARIPSAALGSIALIFFAGITWLIAGPWAALVATFLLAFHPESIRQSRTAGLYSFQQLCGVVALGAGWLATSQSAPQQKSRPADLARRWIWAVLAGFAFLLAGLAHLSAGTVLVGFAAWLLMLAAATVWINGPRAILGNLAAQLVIVGLLGGIALFIVEPNLLGLIRSKIADSSGTTGETGGGAGFYISVLGSQFGWVLTLLPLLALLAFRKYTWLTLFLAFWFVVPLIEHSLLIARKEERMLLMATPALFMLAGLAVAEGREILARAINVHAREWLPSYRSAVRAGDQITWAIIVFALVTLPAMAVSLRVPNEGSTAAKAEWAALRRTLEATPAAANVPVGFTEPLVALQYLGRSDIAIGARLGALLNPAATKRAWARFRPANDSVSLERFSGAVLGRTMNEIRSAFLPYGEVYAVLDSRAPYTGMIDGSILAELDQNGVELCRGRCGHLRLYRLRLTAPQSAQAPIAPPPTPPPA